MSMGATPGGKGLLAPPPCDCRRWARVPAVDIAPTCPWVRCACHGRFAIQPTGNGVQSPKQMEALLVKTIPIVSRTAAHDDLVRLGYVHVGTKLKHNDDSNFMFNQMDHGPAADVDGFLDLVAFTRTTLTPRAGLRRVRRRPRCRN